MKQLLLLFFAGMLAFFAAEAQSKLGVPISPPQLVLPADREQVELPRPLFTWLPPAPYNQFTNLVYDWILVDIAGTQSPADAIQKNIPVFTQQNISLINFQYPLSAPGLDSNKLYAWRVTAKSNMQPVANSEIWTFRLKQPVTETSRQLPKGSYVKMKREQDAAMAVVSGIVRYEYSNDINDTTVSFTVFDITASASKQVPLDLPYQDLHFGKNLLELDLRKNNSLLDKHIYLLQLSNSKGEKWYMKFEYRAPK